MKGSILVYIAGIITGLLIMCLAAFPGQSGGDASVEADSPVPESYSQNTSTQLPSDDINQPQPDNNYQEWSSSQVYTGGDEVAFDGRLYRAKWWTQGERPDVADVWEDTLQSADTNIQTKLTNGDTADSDFSHHLPEDGGFKVVGYYPSWKPNQTDKLRFDVLTHVIYAFAIPDGEGGLRPLENPELAEKIIKEAHENYVKVLIAIGGWSYNDTPLEPAFVSSTDTEEKMRKFADAIVGLCDKYDFDGVDMDWEHPRVDGSSASQYESLMLYLADELQGRDKLLTSAVISGATADGNIYYDAAAHSDRVLAAVDWINVMAYDGGDGERHSPWDFAVSSGSYWQQTRQIPPEKVVLGMPFYGRPGWASYEDMLASDSEAWNKDVTNYNGMEAWYNGVQTIRKKTEYAKNNLGGVMVWEITQDSAYRDNSLMSAIKEAVMR